MEGEEVVGEVEVEMEEVEEITGLEEGVKEGEEEGEETRAAET